MSGCKHYSLRFKDGGFQIVCNLCDVTWDATTDAGFKDHKRRSDGLGESDLRMKPQESSHKNPKVLIEMPKPSDSTKILRPDLP